MDEKLEGLKSKLPIPQGSSVDVGGFGLGQIYNNNPLSKGLMKTVVRDKLVDTAKGAIKDAITDKVNTFTGLADAKE
ncbi:MAG: hypothetical protein ACYDEX_10165 [Mobilitalea sp.]